MTSGGNIGAALIDPLAFLLIWANGLITSGEEQQHAEEDGLRRLDISIGVRVPGLDVFFWRRL